MCKILENTTIYILKQKRKSPLRLSMRWQHSPHLSSLSETLMQSFHFISLGEDEKRYFSRALRRDLNKLRSLTETDYRKGSLSVVKKLNEEYKRSRKRDIHLRARGLAGLLSFAALQSQELDPKIRVQLELDSAPLQLLPKRWSKPLRGQRHSVEILESSREELDRIPSLLRAG